MGEAFEPDGGEAGLLGVQMEGVRFAGGRFTADERRAIGQWLESGAFATSGFGRFVGGPHRGLAFSDDGFFPLKLRGGENVFQCL